MSNIPELFGSLVFNDSVQQKRLPHDTYKRLREIMATGEPLDPAVADVVANVMKAWALDHGVTHFTHWFQPMTGITAEKHDSFISPSGDGVIMVFSGKELIKGEPDASSFPSGGLRATFEARGYTAWDPTSPAFIKDDCLYIPTAFCSYTGEALDKKTPLLRSMNVLEAQTLRVLRLLGRNDIHSVTPPVGAEQEYFLIPRELYDRRRDLIYTGRTLFGAKAPKGQELDDHYFGAIKPRVSAFMKQLDEELWKLGVMAKTEHNEAAPSQHELAPIFTTTNIAADHNQLMMELMQRIAKEHGLVCLLHEKPFEGVNGSGKHNNWSLVTDTGMNLLDGGKDPRSNLVFLLTLAAVIGAVDEYQDLLRISVATAGNDHRLGAAEAPPAIISIFLGEEVQTLLESAASGGAFSGAGHHEIEMKVPLMPHFTKDNSDRNRTSPFAFTGNKFEFRMLGSSLSVSDPNTVINTAVAEYFRRFADRMEQAADRVAEVCAILRDTLAEHGRILFNGDGYSSEWQAEAERRGLYNLRTAPEAYGHLTDDKNIQLFTRHGIFSEAELFSRKEMNYEAYGKTVHIEAQTMLEMARRLLLPAGFAAIREIGKTSRMKQEISPLLSVKAEEHLGTEIANLNDLLLANTMLLENKLEGLGELRGEEARAFYCRDELIPAMGALRTAADQLEQLTPAALWPIPTYGEMLFWG